MTGYTDDHEALVLATLAARVKARQDAVKAVVGQHYPDGRRETVRSPLDSSKLGMIWRSDPEPEWRVTDWTAFKEHLAEFDDTTETVEEIADDDAVIDYLREYAPHLLVQVTKVRQDVIDAALEQSAATGHPAAPGIEMVKRPGALTVKPDKAAAAAVERMVTAGVITWDGRPVIEAAQEAS